MHFFKDGERFFGLAVEFLWISKHFWQPSAITPEPIGIDACRVHIQQLGHQHPAGKITRGFCTESPGMADTWCRGIHGEIWVVSETRIHVEIEGNFLCRFFRDFLEIPCRTYRDYWWIHSRWNSGGFWGESLEIFKKNHRKSTEKSGGNLRDTAIS